MNLLSKILNHKVETPRDTLEEIIFDHLKEEGFKYIKSNSRFDREVPEGRQFVEVCYYYSYGFTSATLRFGFTNYEVEKIYKSLFGAGNSYKHQWTVRTDLINLELGSRNYVALNGVNNKNTYRSIKRAANKLIKEFETVIDPILNDVTSLEYLDSSYNSHPNELVKLNSWVSKKRILTGIIIAHLTNRPNIESLIQAYYTSLEANDFDSKDNMKSELQCINDYFKLNGE